MLTAEGCRTRRRRLLDRLNPRGPLVLGDPNHLRYFANFHVEAISQHAEVRALLVLQPDGHAAIHHDSRMPSTVELSHADERVPVAWYTGQEPGRGPRALLLRPVMAAHGGRIHDALADPLAPQLHEHVAEMRRRKDPDEIELLKTCMRATEAGHAWGRANIRPGMTELDAYAGVASAAQAALGHWAVVYGDFTVATGIRRGGMPTTRLLQNGDTFILDYSVVVQGYRSDFTNTQVIGGEPTGEQLRLFGLCRKAMEAGERELRAGAACQTVADAVCGVFASADVDGYFPTHIGHGLGLEHPEAPFIVRHSTETLLDGDVVTLEPGLYVGNSGIRIEHNYLVTESAFERLSHHEIAPV